MKARHFAVLTAGLPLILANISLAADAGEALFKQHNCSMCHAPASKSLGPSLKEIAAKYAGDKQAPAKLETKVRNGGNGVFGTMPMPATAKSVSDADIKAMVTWILGHK
ncbi:MAG: c-type cytochrome [Pseudomonadota bacterium]